MDTDQKYPRTEIDFLGKPAADFETPEELLEAIDRITSSTPFWGDEIEVLGDIVMQWQDRTGFEWFPPGNPKRKAQGY